MRTIRASEIGAYLFCARAWWYQISGVPSDNKEELLTGSAYHSEHGGRVLLAGIQGVAGWIMLLIAVILLAVALTMKWID